jgi:eukaryotic-like serine/threonine-protein kinase
MPPVTGRVIAGRYNLQHPIGRGAMGVVWRARDQLLDREVAIKEVVISALIGADERHNAYQRTLREARTAARLSHRGVVTIYDVVEEDTRPWIVMELVPSQSLDQVLTADGRLPTPRAGRIGQQLLSALAAAHAAGVLHRDVKPSNVLISVSRNGDGWDERAVLTDFGIAQFEGDPRLTQTGMVMGSPGFTAPERIRGGDATPGSDLWSLGATIYAAVEGRGPYEQRGGAITTMSAIINEDAPVAPHAGKLGPLIAALLRRDPSSRPSASAAARMFAQVLPQLTDTADEPPPAHPATIRSSYVPRPAALAAASAANAQDTGDQPAQEPDAAPGSAESPDAASAAAVAPAAAAAGAASADSAVAAQSAGGARSAAEPEPAADPAAMDEAEPAAAAAAAELSADAAEAPGGDEDTRPRPAQAVPADGADEPKAAAGGEPKAVAGEPETATDGAKSAAAAQSDAGSAPDAEHGPADETVHADQGSLGYQPTELAIPVARKQPAEAEPEQTKPKSAPPKQGQPKSAQPKSAQQAPTFTAAKQADRGAPTFSAANPARPVAPPDPRPAYGSGAPGGYPPGGSTNPSPGGQYWQPGGQYGAPGGQYGPPGGGYPPASGQYAGPSQSYPDLARQYAPGAGGRGGRGSGRGKRIAWLTGAVVIAIGVGVGAALTLNKHDGAQQPTADTGNTGGNVADTPTHFKSVNALNDPSTAVPAGWQPTTLQASDLNSTAGFTIDLPPGWKAARHNLYTEFTGPGDLLIDVDLTPQSTTNMLSAATTLEHQRVSVAHAFPHYKRDNLEQVPVRNTEGAVWKFTWTPPGKPEYVADDILFRIQTSAGAQDYAIYVRSPDKTFSATALPLFDEILRTFQTVPASPTQPPVSATPS